MRKEEEKERERRNKTVLIHHVTSLRQRTEGNIHKL